MTLPLIELFCSSDKYKRLLTAKRHTLPVIGHYAASPHPNYFRYAERMVNCSPDLKVRISVDPNDLLLARVSIEHARWCHVRQCPMCQFAKSSKQRGKLFRAFTGVDFSNRHYLFLTLTIRNRPLSQLKQSLAEMTKAWDRLNRRRTFPALGFLRGMEVTMQYDRLPGDKKKSSGAPTRSPDGELMCHPHFHILMEVKDTYFLSGFKTHDWFVEQWQSALNVDYSPSVSIKKVDLHQYDGVFEKALLETVKYTTKPADFADNADWLYGITEQLHGLRSLAVGGTIAKICSQKELDEIEDTGRASDEVSQVGKLLSLNWNDVKKVWDVFED